MPHYIHHLFCVAAIAYTPSLKVDCLGVSLIITLIFHGRALRVLISAIPLKRGFESPTEAITVGLENQSDGRQICY